MHSLKQKLELLENLKKWFNFKFEIVYFYNVYGPGQIMTGSMATVIGIFEEQFKETITINCVRPGSQSRRFTHIYDTIQLVIMLGKNISEATIVYRIKQSYTIIEVAKMFNTKLSYYPLEKVRDMLQL